MKPTEAQIKKGLDIAYKEAGHNAYFANGFEAGIKFLQTHLKTSNVPYDFNTSLSEYAKKKLEYINGHCIARNFPNNQPTLEWAGAVLDLLEDLKLGNYH